ncbi:hypothetical protein BZK24_08530, partial [Helicobacter pylori]
PTPPTPATIGILTTYSLNTNISTIKEIKNVYQNRQELFSQIYGHVFDNPLYPMNLKNPKKILINPF